MEKSIRHHLDSPPALAQAIHVTPLDAPARTSLFKGLFLLVLLEPIIIIAILAGVGVPWWIIMMVVALIVAIPVFAFWIIHLAAWRPLMNRHHAQPIRSGAVSKSFQSISFGSLMRFNNCLTLVADDEHLHIVPFAPLKWVGARRISLPWNRMMRVSQSRLNGMIKVKLGDRFLSGPEWCMKLAPIPETALTIAV